MTPHSKGLWVAVRPASAVGVANRLEKSARSPPLPRNRLLTDAEGGHEEPRRAGQHLEVLRSGFVNNQADPRDLRKRGRRKEIRRRFAAVRTSICGVPGRDGSNISRGKQIAQTEASAASSHGGGFGRRGAALKIPNGRRRRGQSPK